MNKTTDRNERVSGRTRREIARIDRSVKIGLLAVSGLTVILLAWAALGENTLAKWRRLRGEYGARLREMAEDDFGRNIADAFKLDISQNVILDMNAVDRCVTCHTGIDDPRMADAEQPFATHPGDYLLLHEPAKFGCTVCHEGQGRATTVDQAHGTAPFWGHPLLERKYVKSGCTKCHSSYDLYGDRRLIDKADHEEGGTLASRMLDLGRRLVEKKGCLGCHSANGKGGSIGPDLTRVGDKTPHEFSFAELGKETPHATSVWLKAHFLDPRGVSPGSLMPHMGLSEHEAEALTAVMLSFRSKVPLTLRPESIAEPEVRSGGELYSRHCSACHGPEGKGSVIPEILTPSLNNDDVLGVADDDYLRRIIASGRGGTNMPGWELGRGNLTADEIDRIVEHIRSWQGPAARPGDVKAIHGNAEIGREYYASLCANCHGNEGEGGIGTTLRSPGFQAVASDRYIAETIINGRPGSAMPSWRSLPSQDVADVVAFIRGWRRQAPSFEAVSRIIRNRSKESLRFEGAQLYKLYCSSCHGSDGEGGVGLRLKTNDLLRVVDDRFVYRTTIEGRPSTAMPAWRHLTAGELAAIITHIRSWQDGRPIELRHLPPTGDYIAGEAHYRMSCSRCHGEMGSGGVGPQLTNEVFLDSVSDAQLYHWAANGRSGTAMKGFLRKAQGPAVLTRDQIVDVIAYIRFVGGGGEIPLRRIGEGDPSLGESLFRGNCSSCHGAAGEGSSGPQLNNPVFLKSASDGFLSATMILGREGTPMRSMVKGLQGLGQIQVEQVQDIIAYCRTWEARDVERAPNRSVEMSGWAIDVGRDLYGRYCSGCHGENGRGVKDGPAHYAPALNNQDFLAAASDGFLLATVARGRRGTPMRPFGKGAGGIVSLDVAQIENLVSYIRSWQRGTPHRGKQYSAGGSNR